jgi:flagellar biosynthetic protein FliP
MTTTTTLGAGRARGRPSWRLARHYLEMVVAMLLGMLVLGTLRGAVGLTVPFAEHPGASYVLMATDMALAMAAWMRFRRHGWGSTLEMCAAMYVPALLLPLVWAGAMGAMTFMVVAHVVMLVAMLAVLVRRRHELAHC